MNRVEVKPDVLKGSEVNVLIKACVSASMKQQSYNVYVHFDQESGKVTHMVVALARPGKVDVVNMLLLFFFK